MEKSQLLRNPEIYPSETVLATSLGGATPVYRQFFTWLEDSGIETEWRYYKDGKAWLCKGVYKKKTLFWISIWEGYFKISLYYTEKTRGGIQELPIEDEIKERIKREPVKGKLAALTLDVAFEYQLPDVKTLVEHKK